MACNSINNGRIMITSDMSDTDAKVPCSAARCEFRLQFASSYIVSYKTARMVSDFGSC